MVRILREEPGWEDELGRAVQAAKRPIPLDDRLLPRTADGQGTRRRFERDQFPPARPAATLLAIYPDADGNLVVPLTVRHGDLRAHAGKVSLPGGAVDATDAGPEATALREAWEEVDCGREMCALPARLAWSGSRSATSSCSPFVGTIAARPTLVPHDAEVTAIVELPLAALWDPDVIGVEEIVARGVTLRAGAYRWGGVTVWGATALTLGMLAHVLDE